MSISQLVGDNYHQLCQAIGLFIMIEFDFILITWEFESWRNEMYGFNQYLVSPGFGYLYPCFSYYPAEFAFGPNQHDSFEAQNQKNKNTEDKTAKIQEGLAVPSQKIVASKEIENNRQGELKPLKKSNSCYSFQKEARAVKNRNILPNITYLIISYIKRINKSGSVVKKILQKYKDERYNQKMFFSYQIYLNSIVASSTAKDILHLTLNYCDPSETIFRLDEQRYYNKVCRILIGHYLRVDGPLGLLSSKKEHKTKKRDHFKIYRHILHDLKQYFESEQEEDK